MNKDEYELVAICDKVEALVHDKRKLVDNPDVKLYTDHRKLIDEVDFDAAAIVTEPEYQAPLSIEFMNAGKDVISEVPVSYSLAECWELILTVERTGRVYYLGEQIRHSPMVHHWRKLVKADKLGKILFVEGHYLHGLANHRFWRDSQTGQLLTWKEAANNPNAVKSRFWTLTNPILYAPHELSPLLKILDDRVVRVSCFSTRKVSYRHEEVPYEGKFEPVTKPDIQVAMMHTKKDTIIRFAAGFNVPTSEAHWYHLLGTKGEVETGRGYQEPCKEYYCNFPLVGDSDYRYERTTVKWEFEENSPQHQKAMETGHGGMDFWPVYDFAQVIRGRKKPDIDVYQAVETAAPVIKAVESLENLGALQEIPDFRPGPNRKKGEMPRE